MREGCSVLFENMAPGTRVLRLPINLFPSSGPVFRGGRSGWFFEELDQPTAEEDSLPSQQAAGGDCGQGRQTAQGDEAVGPGLAGGPRGSTNGVS